MEVEDLIVGKEGVGSWKFLEMVYDFAILQPLNMIYNITCDLLIYEVSYNVDTKLGIPIQIIDNVICMYLFIIIFKKIRYNIS